MPQKQDKEKHKKHKLNWLAYAGVAFGIVAFLPQIIRIARTKSSEDVSLLFIWFSIVSSLLLVVYAFANRIEPHAVAGLLTLLVLFILLFYKRRYNGNHVNMK